MLQLSPDELQRIRNAVHGKQIFLVADESTLSAIQYLNILVGSTPDESYLYDYQPLPRAPNSNSIAQAVDDAVRSLEMNKNSFCILLSDASKYMVTAGAILKSLNPKLFYFTCAACELRIVLQKSNLTLKMSIR